MKIKINKIKNEYHASIHTGRGGISSLINARQGKRLLFVLGVFKPKNLWIALFGKGGKR